MHVVAIAQRIQAIAMDGPKSTSRRGRRNTPMKMAFVMELQHIGGVLLMNGFVSGVETLRSLSDTARLFSDGCISKTAESPGMLLWWLLAWSSVSQRSKRLPPKRIGKGIAACQFPYRRRLRSLELPKPKPNPILESCD
mmetsp:Transcript_7240/g.18549  ORF Transcript_7240/g.18549 Transcript_7240/m.18549 type:complete len:139 (-) Transcript_7240:341-757(-)